MPGFNRCKFANYAGTIAYSALFADDRVSVRFNSCPVSPLHKSAYVRSNPEPREVNQGGSQLH